MDKRSKYILNNLKCPLCESQIDLYDFMGRNSKSQSYNFCCASNYYDYQMWFPHWDDPPRINFDLVEVYEGRHKFKIAQSYLINQTIIEMWKVDIEHNIKSNMSKNFTYQQILFDYSNTNRDKIINRIKTILTFQ